MQQSDPIQDNPQLVSPLEQDNSKAEQGSFDNDIIKYVIEERLKPNKIQLKALKQQFIRYDNLYKLVQENKNYKGLANLFIPEILRAVETLISVIHFGIFGNSLFMKYRGYDTKDKLSAENLTHLAFTQMDENNFELGMMDFERQKLIFGTGIRKVLLDFMERRVKSINPETFEKEDRLETYRDIWTFEEVDILNFWIPVNTPWWDIQKADWLAETQNVNEVWIKGKIKKNWINKKQGELLLTYNSKEDTDESSMSNQRLSASGITPDDSKDKYGITTWYGWIPNKYVKDSNDDVDDDELVLGIVIIGNDEIILKKDKLINVYWHNRYPYVSCPFIPISGQFFGMGVPYICGSLQEELNDTRNQTMDNKTALLCNMWLKHKRSGISDDALIFTPNGVVTTNDMDGLRPLAPPLFGGFSITIEGNIKEDIRQSVSAVSGLQGVPQPGVGSATEFQGIQNAAMSRNRLVISAIGKCVLTPVFTLVKHLIYQYFDHAKMVKIMVEIGHKTKMVGPRDIVGNYDIELDLITDFEKNPAVVKQQVLTAMGQIIQLPPQVISFHWKLLNEVFKQLGIKNFSEMYPPPEPDILQTFLTPKEELQVFLEGQPVLVKDGEDHLDHLQRHIEDRKRIASIAPQFILDLMDSHIAIHMQKLEQMKQMAMANQLAKMQQVPQGGPISGQAPNSSPSTMQQPTNDMAIQKGITNV